MPLDFEAVVEAGSMLGTRALQLFDETTCVVRAVLRWTEFYKHESCGKCTPCREGTRWMVQILRRIEDGSAEQDELDLLLNVCDRILGNCLCPLGDAAAMPVASYVARFREEHQRHIDEGGCPFGGGGCCHGPSWGQPTRQFPAATAAHGVGCPCGWACTGWPGRTTPS